MERIENPEKYESKEPLKRRVQKFLLKYIIWVPIVCLLSGLMVMLLIYKHHTRNDVRLGVNYNETVKRDDYKSKKPKSRLEQFQDKLFEKDQVKRRGRYDHIVSGRDVVSVDFGKITYAEGERLPEPEKKDTVVVQVERPEPRPFRRKKKQLKPQIAFMDTISKDTISPKPKSPFASLTLASNLDQQYTLAYVYGDQDMLPNALIKMRLGEPLMVRGNKIPRGTVFTGKINMSANAIYISVERIERFDVSYQVYDTDYSHGIVINRPKGQDMENAVNTSAYRTAGRSVIDLPYDILQDVTQSIIQHKRKKQRTIKLNDGYTVYLAKG